MDLNIGIEIIQIFKSVAQSGVYTISTNLLYPVIIILFGLFAWSVIELGGFLFEWRARHRDFWLIESGALKALEMLKSNDFTNVSVVLKKFCTNRFLHNFINNLSEFQNEFHNKDLMRLRVEKLLQECDAEISKKLEKPRFIAKAGPMFGLMGTLIPMGPALSGLAQGDIQTLSDNLIMAFGTTVIGLVAGVSGYMVSVIRNRWYAQDMGDIEYISEMLFGEHVFDIEESKQPDTDELPENAGTGIYDTIKVFSGFVYYDLFFMPTGVIIARTAGSILSKPLVLAALFGVVNIVILITTKAGYTILPSYLYILFINLFIFIIISSSLLLTKKRAEQISYELSNLPLDGILKYNARNVEISYSDIKEINISRTMMKIFTDNRCIKVGRIVSLNYLNRIQTLPVFVTIGGKI
ncbi:MAG: MotA/TolQ/ExbB proton channel family protein [Methanosarcinaceae archaeon]